MHRRRVMFGLAVAVIVAATVFGGATAAFAAYHHAGESDSDAFLVAHPDAAGTKLDSCVLCHSGGSYVAGGKTTTLGSCQWCHYKYGYDSSGDIMQTLNAYGLAYHTAGSDAAAVSSIDGLDSDGDGFTNVDEIAAVRFPGDAKDDPTKVPAPYAVYDLADIQAMPAHTQFMLMNTHKSTDFYGTYTGVPMEYLLDDAGMLPSAEGVNVFAPDGFSTFHPLDPTPGFYHVRGTYPAASFYYSMQADKAFTSYGWCDFSAASVAGRSHLDPIVVDGGLKTLLAYEYEGDLLVPGRMDASNKLSPDSEGPFRVVPPQLVAGPPDQSSKSTMQSVIWPFDAAADHNAGYSTKCATIVKVGPLPAGTTDIDTMEAGWGYVDEGKVVVYGAIDPVPTAIEKLRGLREYVLGLEAGSVRGKNMQRTYAGKIDVVIAQLAKGNTTGASAKIGDDLLPKVDGVVERGTPDLDDWVTDPVAQRRVYWGLRDMLVLLAISQ